MRLQLAASAALLLFTCLASATAISIPVGNGDMIYSVASDMYCSQHRQACPDYVPFADRVAGSHIIYVMPSVGSLMGAQSNSIYQVCGKVPAKTGIDYFAKPRLTTPASTAQNPVNFLGQCEPGKSVTAYYHYLGKSVGIDFKVLPLFSVSSIPSTASAAEKFADTLATLINGDPNANGVSLDYEPSIKPTEAVETDFMSELSLQLAKKGKLLAVFDGNNDALSPGYGKNKNVIALYSLYDLGSFKPPAPAVSPTDYYNKQLAFEVDKGKFNLPEGYFATSKGMPVLFVVPASATDTLYTGIRLYNMNSYSIFNKKFTKLPYASESKTCQPRSSITRGILQQYLCLPKNPLKPYPDCKLNQVTAVSSFYNAEQAGPISGIHNYCAYYQSNDLSGYSMQLYVAEAFRAIRNALASKRVSHTGYLGVALYSDRIPEFADFGAATHYYNTEIGDVSELSRFWSTVPCAISGPVWSYIEKNTPEPK